MLREWLGTLFSWFDVIPLHRQRFGRRDLGVTLVIAYRNRKKPPRGTVISARAFADLDKRVASSLPVPMTVTRGSLSTTDMSERGSVSVLHCGSDRLQSSYCERHTTIVRARRALQWANPGDVLICRIGQGAGMASLYHGPTPAPITDCLFVVRAADRRFHRRLQDATQNGLLGQMVRQSAHGLGARFVTRDAVLGAVERVAFKKGADNGP
jgi:hypothetical protein